MIQSNDILFNEPALQSLKRAQLLALCKRYNIKQSGKNEELVGRLRTYAQTLLDQEQDATASNKTSNNNAKDNSSQQPHARTSDQWELVEEDSREEDMSMTLDKRSRTLSMKSMMSMGTVKSHVSSKDVNMDSVSSRGSSLKSLATSLKRAGSKNSKMSVSTTDSIVRKPMSHLFPPVPTNTVTSANERAEGKSLEEGATQKDDPVEPIVEGTVDASTLDKNQTTIRLVVSPPRPSADEPRIKATPNLRPFSLIFSDSSPKENATTSVPEVTLSRPRTPEKTVVAVAQEENLLGGSPAPFVFGSPAHAVSNLQFNNAAAAILEEMNKRLGLDSTSSGAAKISEDGTLNFGEVTPSRKATLTMGTKKEEGRFGRAHEKAFEKMDSIANHYTMKRAASPVKPGPLAGTKRKSMHVVENARPNGTKVICLDDPKDQAVGLPAPKRQKVDGADLVKKSGEVAFPTKPMAKEEVKKKQERRRSSKGRGSLGGSTSRRRSIAGAKAAPTSRFGMLRTGAAKVVKSLVSSVVNGSSTATTSKTIAASKATVPPAAPPKPAAKAKETVPTVQRAPSRQAPSRMSTASSARPSTIAPRASATRSEEKASTTTRSTGPPLPIKDVRRPTLTRVSTAGVQRGGLPSFQATTGSSRTSISKKTNVEPAKATTSARQSVAEPSNVEHVKPARRTSKINTDSIKSKAEVPVADEERPSRSVTRRNPDFEPGMGDGERSRSCSPLPAPPASLSSRPLNRRIAADSTEANAPSATEEGKGSLGRKPRISRSKVIAKVHESRQAQKTSVITPLKSANVSNVAKARKSAGLSAKAKLMGTDGARGRASAVAASAETAMRKARVSQAAEARRRTMAKA